MKDYVNAHHLGAGEIAIADVASGMKKLKPVFISSNSGADLLRSGIDGAVAVPTDSGPPIVVLTAASSRMYFTVSIPNYTRLETAYASFDPMCQRALGSLQEKFDKLK